MSPPILIPAAAVAAFFTHSRKVQFSQNFLGEVRSSLMKGPRSQEGRGCSGIMSSWLMSFKRHFFCDYGDDGQIRTRLLIKARIGS